jgi:cytochrome c551/c552
VGEVLLWLLFFALLVPAGFTGWAVGHYTSQNRTVTRTVTVAAGATTTAGQPTTTTSTVSATTTTAPATATTARVTTTAGTTTAAPAGASAARGKAVFAANGCASCHTFKPAGSTGTVGPDLDTQPAADAKRAKLALAAFIRQSITAPDAFIAPGYPKGVMPTTFGALGTDKIDDLVAFILSGRR